GVPLLEGSVEDRPVELALKHRLAEDLDTALAQVLEPCADGEQALVFCSSRAAAEKVAHTLAPMIEGCLPQLDREHLARLADRIRENDPAAEDVVELLPKGV